MARLAAAFAVLAALLALAFPAFAFKPPPLDGHVLDTSGSLSPDEIAAVDAKLDDVRRRTGFEIVAFVPGSLEGEPIEDVAFAAFNTWHIGQKGKDNGVLLVIAPKERRTRIETGKGVEGPLTDLQSDDIILQYVVPALKEGRVFDAVDQGTTAIARTLTGEPGAPPRHKAVRPRAPAREPLSLTQVGMIGGGLLLIILLAVVSPGFRSFLWFFIGLFLGGRGGGGGFGGGGGGDGGGSGYSGGGGSSGGGGASEGY